jgi:hypothetical protein
MEGLSSKLKYPKNYLNRGFLDSGYSAKQHRRSDYYQKRRKKKPEEMSPQRHMSVEYSLFWFHWIVVDSYILANSIGRKMHISISFSISVN